MLAASGVVGDDLADEVERGGSRLGLRTRHTIEAYQIAGIIPAFPNGIRSRVCYRSVQIVSLLGAGGMGEVYRAHDPRLRRDVAIKLISRALASDGVTVDRFIREALSASALNHPNVVTIYETGETPNGRYIAMELVQGATLPRGAA